MDTDQNKSFWGATAELREEPAAPPAPAPGAPAPQANAPAAPAAPAPAPVSRAILEGEARMAVSVLNLTQALIYRPLANWKFNRLEKKYIPDEEERELAARQLWEQQEPANQQEQRNQTYLEKLIAKRLEVLQNIPFNEEKEKDLVRIIADYEQATGTRMSPKLMLWAGIFGVLGQNAYDIAFADINITE